MATTPKIAFLSTFALCIFFVSAFSPADHYLVNCGSRAATTLDRDNRVFTGDNHQIGSTTRSTPLETTDPKFSSSSPLYVTARAFSRPLRYAFPIRSIGTHHLVRLHFHPLPNNHCNLFEAEFHVIANGFLLLRNFRIPKTDNFPVIKEFVIPVASEQLEITLIPSEKSKFGFISAIEVISAPRDLIADVAQFVDSGKNERINGLLKSGFETVHRVNVGGFKVTPFNDSLWRTWVTDDEHLRSNHTSEKIYFGGRIQYQMGGASREVGPDNVYNTARVIKSSNDSVPNANITLSFEVLKGYRYMVRLHFCDIASLASGTIYFNVYVNGHSAFDNLDLSYITNGLLASPFYADFVVDGGDNSSGELVVSVGPSNMSLARAVDSILNGVEVWKLNNSLGSFDGEVCADYAWKNWRKGHTGILLSLFAAAMLLLLSASMFFNRNRSRPMAWSQLPREVSEANLKSGA